jgi:hypothetical protein
LVHMGHARGGAQGRMPRAGPAAPRVHSTTSTTTPPQAAPHTPDMALPQPRHQSTPGPPPVNPFTLSSFRMGSGCSAQGADSASVSALAPLAGPRDLWLAWALGGPPSARAWSRALPSAPWSAPPSVSGPSLDWRVDLRMLGSVGLRGRGVGAVRAGVGSRVGAWYLRLG